MSHHCLRFALLVTLLGPIGLGAQQSVNYRTGFPVASGWLVDRSSPAVGNLDGDPQLEIVVGSIDRNVYAFNHDGSPLAGWPVFVGAEVNSSPAIGDVDGDGVNEVVVGAGWQDLTNDGAVWAFEADGTVMQGWPFVTRDLNLGPNGHSDGVFGTPALVDLTGDGKLEVVVGSFDQYLYAIRSDGSLLWEFFLYDSTWSSPAVGDLDGDGQPDIVIAAYTHAGFPPGLPTVDGGGIMWALERTGAVKPGWPVVAALHFDSSPALGDLDGDGDLEIVIGTGQEVGTPVGNKVFAYHHTGASVAGWPVTTVSDYIFPSPALGDLDSDGLPEVVVSSADGRLYAFNGNGTALAGWPVQPTNESGLNGGLVGSPVIADLDNNGDLEVLIAIGWDIVGYNHNGSFFKYGAEAQLRMHTLFSVGGTPAIADLDGNGRLDVLIGSANAAFMQGRLWAWELPAAAVPVNPAPWAMWRADQKRLGRIFTQLFEDGFESGDLTAWSGQAP